MEWLIYTDELYGFKNIKKEWIIEYIRWHFI
jgi:hypothetical protein